MTRVRLEALQWFALLGGPLAWTVDHVTGYFIAVRVRFGSWWLSDRQAAEPAICKEHNYEDAEAAKPLFEQELANAPDDPGLLLRYGYLLECHARNELCEWATGNLPGIHEPT